jgi:hypothetical protein
VLKADQYKGAEVISLFIILLDHPTIAPLTLILVVNVIVLFGNPMVFMDWGGAVKEDQYKGAFGRPLASVLTPTMLIII